jgi:hypothetical protein
MKTVKVPKTPASAFNPGRPASDLLRWKVEQLHAALAALDPSRSPRAPRRRRRMTEGAAAREIEALTRRLVPALAAAQAAARTPGAGDVKKRPARPRRKTTRRKAR